MKSIILFLSFLLVSLYAGAQTPVSAAMEQYISGCEKLLTGFDTKRLSDVAEAKILLSKPRLTTYQDFEVVNATDSCKISLPSILFTPDFAREIIKSGVITDPREQSNPYLMRKEDDFDLQIWNASIAPNSSVAFKGVAVDDCEMLLLSEIHSGLTLSVSSDYSASEIKTESLNAEHSEYSTSVWHMEEQGDFFFTITNNSDRKQTFVIAIN